MEQSIIEKTTIALPSSFKKVLKTINSNKLGIVFVIDNNGRLIGSITDGDIRRAIIQGIKLEEDITIDSSAVNRKPTSLPFESDIQEILNCLDQKHVPYTSHIRCVPLLDSKGKIVDISTRSRLRQFPISQPGIGSQELNNVIDCIKTGWISSKGTYITKCP